MQRWRRFAERKRRSPRPRGLFPTLSFVSNVNTLAGRVKITGGNQPTGLFSAAEPSYGAGLFFEWNLFEGGATQRKVELAEAERRAAEAEVTAARDKAIRDVWKATRTSGSRCAGSMSPRPGGCLAEVLRIDSGVVPPRA